MEMSDVPALLEERFVSVDTSSKLYDIHQGRPHSKMSSRHYLLINAPPRYDCSHILHEHLACFYNILAPHYAPSYSQHLLYVNFHKR